MEENLAGQDVWRRHQRDRNALRGKAVYLLVILSSVPTVIFAGCTVASKELPVTVPPIHTTFPPASPTPTTELSIFLSPDPTLESQDPLTFTKPTEDEEPVPTDEWAVQLSPGVDPDEVASEHNAINLGPIGTLPRFYLFRRPDRDPYDISPDPLAEDQRVEWIEQQYKRQRSTRRTYDGDCSNQRVNR